VKFKIVKFKTSSNSLNSLLNSLVVPRALAMLVTLAAFLFLFGCVTQPTQQESQANQTIKALPPTASLRPHVTTPSPYPTALPSITPTPFLECEKDSDCLASGCSGEVCARKTYNTPCVFKPEFECLKLTKCGCTNGVCGWKQNDAFKQCLKNKES